jgi:hypothetical protein
MVYVETCGDVFTMRAIETEMSVAADGKAVIVLQLPSTVTVGKHRAVVVLDARQTDEPRIAAESPLPVELPLHDFGPWPADLSLQREHLYGDQGR